MEINSLIAKKTDQKQIADPLAAGLKDLTRDQKVAEKPLKTDALSANESLKPDSLELSKNVALKQSHEKTIETITPTKAQETVNFVKTKIVEQSSSAVLTQANLSSQIVLTIMQQ